MSEPVEILLVEDYPVDQQLAVRFLQEGQLPHKVHVLRDGLEALDFVFCRGVYQERSFERPPSVVLLDIRLPELDGWKVLAEMKQDPRTSHIPVLMTSAYVSSKELEKSQRLGATGCIQKPVQLAKISAALNLAGIPWIAG
jgi:two-component system response regulator